MLHVHDFKSAIRLREVYGPELKKILVVGGRVSAGQTATELADAEGYQVDLCLKQPLKFSRDPWLQRLSFWIYYQIEDFRARVNPNGVDDTNPPMEGGRTRRLIQAGRIGTRPEIAKVNGKEVRFLDGTLEHYDLIIFCTGFRPVLAHLEPLLAKSANRDAPALRGMESIDAPGLFFIGLDKLTNFRSRYLRGIREDAIVLADTVARKIKP
jgi:putative flavoprotein involved in K+ transport